jgi:hypothetical protein
MTVAEQVRAQQDGKEMTRRAIKLLEALGEDVAEFKAEFSRVYGEELNNTFYDDLRLEQTEQM